LNWGYKPDGSKNQLVVKGSVIDGGHYFGEHNAANQPHGKGIMLEEDGQISIGYRQNGEPSTTGLYVLIPPDGALTVGERTIDPAGKVVYKGTIYYLDGTSNQFLE
jgi:hypothetical protein